MPGESLFPATQGCIPCPRALQMSGMITSVHCSWLQLLPSLPLTKHTKAAPLFLTFPFPPPPRPSKCAPLSPPLRLRCTAATRPGAGSAQAGLGQHQHTREWKSSLKAALGAVLMGLITPACVFEEREKAAQGQPACAQHLSVPGAPTYFHDPPEDRGVVHRAAVPPPLPKLVLALLDGTAGPFPDEHHVLLVELAELALPRGEPRQLAAHRLSADDVHLRSLDGVHGQRPAMRKTSQGVWRERPPHPAKRPAPFPASPAQPSPAPKARAHFSCQLPPSTALPDARLFQGSSGRNTARL